jgi:hypothetical protein
MRYFPRQIQNEGERRPETHNRHNAGVTVVRMAWGPTPFFALAWAAFIRDYSFAHRVVDAARPRVVPVSRLETRADPLQKFPDLLAKGMHFRVVDQLQHGLGIHERNRYVPIDFFAHDHVAR